MALLTNDRTHQLQSDPCIVTSAARIARRHTSLLNDAYRRQAEKPISRFCHFAAINIDSPHLCEDLLPRL
jgi:hypothetical protein